MGPGCLLLVVLWTRWGGSCLLSNCVAAPSLAMHRSCAVLSSSFLWYPCLCFVVVVNIVVWWHVLVSAARTPRDKHNTHATLWCRRFKSVPPSSPSPNKHLQTVRATCPTTLREVCSTLPLSAALRPVHLCAPARVWLLDTCFASEKGSPRALRWRAVKKLQTEKRDPSPPAAPSPSLRALRWKIRQNTLLFSSVSPGIAPNSMDDEQVFVCVCV